jgi:glycine oxidase
MIAVAGELGDTDGPEAQFARHSSALWPEFANQIEAESGREIAYRRCGALMVFRRKPKLAQWGALEWLDTAEVRAREPMLTPDISGALWAPDEAQVDNRALGVALAIAFQRAGGDLHINEAAVRFEVTGDHVVSVASPFRQHEADAFLIAAGAWSGDLGGLPSEVLPRVKPVKGEMLAVAPRDLDQLPKQVVWGNEVYLVPRKDRLLIGATVADAGFDTSVTDSASAWLSSRATALMPALAQWNLVEHWAGLRPRSRDDLPILGRGKLANLFIASGQYRNGILFAPAIAELLPNILLDGAPEIPAFDPGRSC